MFLEHFVFSVVEALMIFMSLNICTALFKYVDCYVTAVIGDSLIVSKQIVEYESVLKSTFTPADSVDVIGLDSIT